MSTYQTAVVGVHDSPTGTRAVELGALLAAELGTRLVMVAAHASGRPGRVVEPALASRRGSVAVADRDDDGNPEADAGAYRMAGSGPAGEALRRGEQFCAQLGMSDVVSVAREGRAVPVLLGAVEEFNAGLLIVGSQGISGMRGRLLSSVPKGVTWQAECDVMIVHTTHDRLRNLVSLRSRRKPSGHRRTVLVGVHDSPRAMRAVDRAAGIAAETDAKLVLAGVHQREDKRSIDRASDNLGAESYLAQGTFAIGLVLNDAKNRAKAMGVPEVEQVYVEGEPMRGLVTAADRYRADLLVMGNHQMTGRTAKLIDTVSSQVTRKIATHVLLVH